MNRCTIVAIPLVALVGCAGAAHADVGGRASVIDGDTLEVHGERVRLFGIDAPESRQLCTVAGQPYRCGQQAALALADYLAQRTVRSEERDRDRYGRIVAVCFVGEEDVQAWLVEQGWALAFRRYSTDYVGEEDAARAARRGIWRGTFEAPWEWRAARR
jgi:endonuclease YncB( thermonuclease family)